MTRPALTALLLALLLALPHAAPPRAQDASRLSKKITALERKLAALENELALLRERLDAVLGEAPENKVHEVPIGDSPVRGNPRAPLTLVMFGDYQSDYTARAQHVVKRLLETYPERLRFVYKHYPLTQQHPLANEAALAALAAERQQRFWPYHDQLFLNSRRLEASLLLVLADQAGLDLTRFNRDRRSLWALERLDADEQLAAELGVNALPALFLNGRRMTTWRLDYLQRQIEALSP